ncbi:MAG: S41 family peptidase [Acidobacteriota bacterium]
MSRERRILKYGGVALAAALLLIITNLAAASNRTGGIDGAPVVDGFVEALTLVEANYAGEVDYDRVADAAVSGMLRILDPHSNFYNKEEFLELRSQQQSEYFGIGATVVQRQDKVYILAPFANTPAARAGLRYGDHIVSVNGSSTKGWDSSKVSTNLKGPRGTQVVVGVERPGEAKPLEFTISRDAVSLPSIANSYMIKPGVGYIWLRRQFARTTGDEIREAIAKLKPQGINQLLLDLRDNPGGLVQAALDVSDTFLSRGQGILTIKARQGGVSERSFDARNATPESLPLVVIVNGNSASASEIVAGAFQDHDRAIIVGETTFGKGLVQTIFPLSSGTGLTLTTAKYYTPSGRLIQRDYDSISRYNYYLRREEHSNGNGKDTRPQFRTDGGRVVYGGGGITPDTIVKARRFSNVQLRLQGPLFLFTRELIHGQMAGLSQYKSSEMNFNHILKPEDFAITDKVIEAFKNFLATTGKEYNLPASVVNDNLELIKLNMRFEIATAAYGTEIAQQVLIDTDPQVLKAVSELPRAKELLAKSKQVAANN